MPNSTSHRTGGSAETDRLTSATNRPSAVAAAAGETEDAPPAGGLTVQSARQRLNITVDLIPASNRNRPGTPLNRKQITIHNTDNDDAGANARAHAIYMKGADAQERKVSWHFTVDDTSVYQSLPLNEVGWHAGNGEGNRTTIGIEICQNRGIDQDAANDRAALLTALMLHELNISLAGNVVQHHHWSGKDCPMLLRHPASRWDAFLRKVADYYADLASDDDDENDHDSGPTDGSPEGINGPLRSVKFAGNTVLQETAASLRPPFSRGSTRSEEVGMIQDALDTVAGSLGMPRIDAGANRGIYGPRTQAAVERFQQRMRLDVDGKVGRNTLRALDRILVEGPSPEPPPPPPDTDLLRIAASSPISRYHWNNRGRAPLGYIKGMAMSFGRVLCKLRAGDAAAVAMARADRNAPNNDALTHYREVFAAAGLNNSEDGEETLRNLFTLMLGLGMRESSGAYCEGRDTTNASSNTADTAEAGLFQMSWNSRAASPLLPQLFAHYSARPDTGFKDIFKEQVTCSAADWRTIGTGAGAQFQELSKNCPAFAVEYAGVSLRVLRRHWGPINTHAAEVRPEAEEMFQAVQRAITDGRLCPL